MILNDADEIVGYVWATFTDVIGYKSCICNLNDIFVDEPFRTKGIASEVIKVVEKHALKNGANLFRSGTGAFNKASIKMHEKAGFYVYRHEYEKKLEK
jgi:GNAT superfamily N-acetyltransferase